MDGFNIPAARGSEQKRMDIVAGAAATDVGCSPGPEPSHLKCRVVPPGASALDGWGGRGGVVFLQQWRVELVSEQLRQFKVPWLVVFCLFGFFICCNNLLGKFCIDTQSRFLVEDQFQVFIFRCQWKFLNDLFHALCRF